MTIKELRASLKLSQSAFAKSIGAGLSTVTAYEAGKREPSEKMLAKIKEVYGVDLNAAPEKAKPARKPRARKADAPKPEAKPAARKPRAKKAAPVVIIQSPLGGEITPEDILAKAGPADRIYVRVDENKAYVVTGDETRSVDLW